MISCGFFLAKSGEKSTEQRIQIMCWKNVVEKGLYVPCGPLAMISDQYGVLKVTVV